MSDHHPEYVRGVEDGIKAAQEMHEAMCPHAAEVGLRAEADQLRAERDDYARTIEGLREGMKHRQAEIARLRAERDALREALEWYARPGGYTAAGVKTDGAAFGYDHPDRGAHARDVLRGIG